MSRGLAVALTHSLPLLRGAGPVLEAVPAARAGPRVPHPQAHLLHPREDEEPRDQHAHQGPHQDWHALSAAAEAPAGGLLAWRCARAVCAAAPRGRPAAGAAAGLDDVVFVMMLIPGCSRRLPNSLRPRGTLPHHSSEVDRRKLCDACLCGERWQRCQRPRHARGGVGKAASGRSAAEAKGQKGSAMCVRRLAAVWPVRRLAPPPTARPRSRPHRRRQPPPAAAPAPHAAPKPVARTCLALSRPQPRAAAAAWAQHPQGSAATRCTTAARSKIPRCCSWARWA